MKTVEELERIRKQAQAMTRLREGGDTTKIVVGMGTCGIAAGARETLSAIMDELARRNIQDVIVTQTGCIGPVSYTHLSLRPMKKVFPYSPRQNLLLK